MPGPAGSSDARRPRPRTVTVGTVVPELGRLPSSRRFRPHRTRLQCVSVRKFARPHAALIGRPSDAGCPALRHSDRRYSVNHRHRDGPARRAARRPRAWAPCR
eukprot:134762-Hanusia_phi.AAC.2